MTRWQFDDGSTVETVANDSSSVTYEISSLSTDHTGVYYCEAIIDGMTDTSMNYTLFGEYYYSKCLLGADVLSIVCDSVGLRKVYIHIYYLIHNWIYKNKICNTFRTS